MTLQHLNETMEKNAELVRSRFEEIDAVREKAYKLSRDVVRLSANTIRAIHRSEWQSVDEMLAKTRAAVQDLTNSVTPFPQLFWAGYTQDCLKEYAEVEHTYAFIRQLPIQSYEELGISEAAWLNGLAEASTELRRRILDIIRHDHSGEAEQLLEIMDDVYSLLITFDFRDAITNGLRRRTDQVRAVLERTRGDVTNSLRQSKLEAALSTFEKSVSEG
ncbi:MAG: hypothetical protein QNJ45_28390 [Ardenticatenaceae bacterium]|nr:hypothetical protein [Ardenticatenaceae bacterium]